MTRTNIELNQILTTARLMGNKSRFPQKENSEWS